MNALLLRPETTAFPGWVPVNIANYLMHTVGGVSIRELGRQRGCHASTVLRQVRRMETRRDDPLVDSGLTRLGEDMRNGVCPGPADAELEDGAARVLRRLCESGAVLAVAGDMPNAIVMRGGDGATATRTAIVSTEVAQAMALLDWLDLCGAGAIQRYRISAAGRAAMGQLVAAVENRARVQHEDGFAEAQAPFGGVFTKRGDAALAKAARRSRYIAAESPLLALSRRRDKDGNRFLDADMVKAGERLREDYELARLDVGSDRELHLMLRAGAKDLQSGRDGSGSARARRRLATALEDLGPGLADVALRCCCYLEGLERTEKRMGWSARSGKIVLRIALQRLALHYRQAAQDSGDMIG